MTVFRAWVPNKTGLLSFSQIGALSAYANADCNEPSVAADGCYFYCVERRTTKLDDSVFNIADFLGRVSKKKKEIFFVLDAICETKSPSSDTLKGTIHCKYGDPKSTVKTRKDTSVLTQVFSVSFSLHRNGTCEFSKQKLEKNVRTSYSGPAPLAEYLTSQSYMFLRDMVHRHKHHDPKSDTFLDIKSNNKHWPYEIAYNLGKMVIKQPISGKPKSIQDALGILSYLESLQASKKLKVYDPLNISATRNSLDAEYKRVVQSHANLKWVWGVILAAYYYWVTKSWDWIKGIHDIFPIVTGISGVLLLIFAFQATDIIDFRFKQRMLELEKVTTFNKFASLLFLVFIMTTCIIGMYLLLNIINNI